MLFLRATGLPFYLYDTRSAERLHLRRKIIQALRSQSKDGSNGDSHANDLQLLFPLLVVCLIHHIRCTLCIVKSYFPSPFFFFQQA